jgi:hypothetical protein
VPAARCAEALVRTKLRQIAEIGVGPDDDVAAVAAVAAVRPASRNVFLATKGDRTVAAAAGGYVDLRAVVEQARPFGVESARTRRR